MRKSLALFPFAAVVGIFALAGCGGSSSVSSASSSGSVNFSGSSTSTGALTTDSTVPASGGATVQTSVNGTLGSAVIPSGAVAGGATVSSTEALAILPINTGFQGSYLSGQQMTVNGVSQSGVGISASGLTEENVALPVAAGTTGTLYTLGFPGGSLKTTPPALGVNPLVLTIQQTNFVGRFYVLILNGHAQVVSPVPISMAGQIPNNGETAVGCHVQANFSGGNNGRKATLSVDYGNGFTLTQTQTISGGIASFSDLKQDTSKVPTKGVKTVSFVIGDLP